MRARAWIALLAAWLWSPHVLQAQYAAEAAPGGVGETQRFLERARLATARYRELEAAAFDGYRRLGPDFPGMGVHWVHPGLLLDGHLDPDRPQVLSYATVRGRPVLVGVAYALPLAPGQSPPAVPAGAWHEHSGTIEEESVLLHQTVSGQGGRDGTRVAMLHAWLHLENPAGVFASDNWALPYARVGLTPPAGGSVAAARALSLAAGGDGFYLRLVRTLTRAGPEEVRAMAAVLARHRDEVERWLAGRLPGDTRVGAGELARLEEVWTRLWTEIAAGVGSLSAARLRPLVADYLGAGHPAH